MKNFIFDTNAYRNFVAGKTIIETRDYFNQLVEKEKEKGHIALMSPIVILELMSHLADVSDKDYNVCHKALIGSYIHCKEADNNFRMLLDFETHLCKLIFNEDPVDSIKEQRKFGKIQYGIFSDSTDDYIKKSLEGFKDIKSFIDKTEDNFVKDMKKDVIQPILDAILDNRSKFKNDFQVFVEKGKLKRTIAFSQFVKTINIINKNLMDFRKEEINTHIEYILNKFETPITLYQNLIINIVDSDGNLKIEKKARPNLIWDFAISFAAGRNEINGELVKLVTDDGAILKAAKDAGFNESIIKLEDYLKLLN